MIGTRKTQPWHADRWAMSKVKPQLVSRLFLLTFENFIIHVNYFNSRILIQFFIQKGLPYKHKILFAKGTPIWATKVNCTGSEYKLSQCPNFTLGHVDDCIERYDAGVVCYSTVGKQTAVYTRC